ncbi:MAG: hypothetical protein JWP02_4001 [Acidimicrobiales bacterium]|nr:hypothetical protein [Acidimicrobiales bacterium]
MRRRAALIVLLGAGVRVALAAHLWHTALDPDGREYLALARRFSVMHPWAAGPREPLWVLVVKGATGPFGYTPHALRVVGVALGVGGLIAAWALLRRVARERVALIALGVLAIDPLLVYDAARGLREPLALLLMIPVLAVFLDDPRLAGLRRFAPACLIALPLVRWELGILALVATVTFVIVRRRGIRKYVLAVAAAAALTAPWLVANGHRYGDALYHSNRAAVFARNLDIVYGGHAGPRPDSPYGGPSITWTAYYLHFLGPREAAGREVAGTGANLATLVDAYPDPPWPGWPLTGTGGRATVAGRALVFLVAGSLAVVGIVLARPEERTMVRTAAAIVLVDALAYAVAIWRIDYRPLTWSLPALSLVVATGADIVVSRRRASMVR